MTYLKVRNVTRNADLGQKVRIAATLLERTIGLLSTKSLGAGEGLWLSPCASIHTCFMRFPIDVLFLDSEGTVLYQNTYKPWRLSGWRPKTRGVLEVPAGTLKRTRTQPGDRIDMKAAR